MSYDPYQLVVDTVVAKLTADCKTAISESDTSRVDIVADYDLSGSPTKPDVTANKIVVSPDRKIGNNRGFYDKSGAIGFGPRTWAYHVEVWIEVFPVRVTKVKAEVRDMMSKVMMRAMISLHDLQNAGLGGATDDGKWVLLMASDPYIQGGGTIVKDAGANRAIKAEQRLIVGFILQYMGG